MFLPGQWRLDVSHLNTPHYESNAWEGLDESKVFKARMTHLQSGNEWTLRIGRGGQIYSISTPEVGEMIAAQRVVQGTWIDEVFQHVIPHPRCQVQPRSTDIVDGDIHQAGFYTHSDLTKSPLDPSYTFSVFSPSFPSILRIFREETNSYALTTWPQHAHLPRTFTDNGMLMHQSTRDLGDGVIEVTLVINKWQGADTNRIVIPSTSWRTPNLPSALISNPDGSYQEDNSNLVHDRDPAKNNELHQRGLGMRRLANRDTGGWIAFAQSPDKDDAHRRGVAVVFGSGISPIEDQAATGPSYVLWGRYPSSDGTPYTRWDRTKPFTGGTVAFVGRNIGLKKGDSIYARYFLIIGTVSKIREYGRLLESKVEIGRIVTPEGQSGLIRLCTDPVHGLSRTCPDPNSTLFYAYRDFQPDAMPLFLLSRRDGTRLVTTDPYEVSTDPTDLETTYENFLGWAVPNRDAQASCFDYLRLSDLQGKTSVVMGESAKPLYVRTPALNKPAGVPCSTGP